MAEDHSGSPGGAYRWFLVAALFTIWTIVFGIQYSFGIFFRHLQEALGCSRGTISLAMTLHLLVFAGIMVPSGWAISRFNVRTVYSLAALGLGLPLVLCSQVLEPWELYLLYGFMGISSGIYGPSIFALIIQWFTVNRGLALGLASAGAGFGTLIAAPLSNALITSHGWRNSFAILGMGSFCLLLAISQFIKKPPGPFFDTDGSLNGKVINGRQTHPLTPPLTIRQVIITKDIFCIIAGSAAAQTTSRLVTVHLAPHTIDIGLTSFAAAMALSLIGCGSILGRILMGSVQDRIGARNSMILCLIIMGICLIALPAVESNKALFLFALLFGFAFGGDVPQVPAVTVHCFGVASMRMIYPFIASTVNVGSALGPSIAGYIFDFTNSYTVVFLGLSVLLFLGAFSISRIQWP